MKSKKFFRDNSKSFALSGLKFIQSSSEPKSTPWTNFHKILRDEGVKFEKLGKICRGMPQVPRYLIWNEDILGRDRGVDTDFWVGDESSALWPTYPQNP